MRACFRLASVWFSLYGSFCNYFDQLWLGRGYACVNCLAESSCGGLTSPYRSCFGVRGSSFMTPSFNWQLVIPRTSGRFTPLILKFFHFLNEVSGGNMIHLALDTSLMLRSERASKYRRKLNTSSIKVLNSCPVFFTSNPKTQKSQTLPDPGLTRGELYTCLIYIIIYSQNPLEVCTLRRAKIG